MRDLIRDPLLLLFLFLIGATMFGVFYVLTEATLVEAIVGGLVCMLLTTLSALR